MNEETNQQINQETNLSSTMPTNVSFEVHAGTNELIYRDRYESFVAKVLADVAPTHQTDFADLSPSEIKIRIDAVEELLARIEISTADTSKCEGNVSVDLLAEDNRTEKKKIHREDNTEDRNCSIKSEEREKYGSPTFGYEAFSGGKDHEMSEVPHGHLGHHDWENESEVIGIPSPSHILGKTVDYGTDREADEDDCSSVEMGRGTLDDSSTILLSPVAHGKHASSHMKERKKRLATNSGKKGMDIQRSRVNSVGKTCRNWGSKSDYNERISDYTGIGDVGIDSPLAVDVLASSSTGRNGRESLSFLLESQSPIAECGTYDESNGNNSPIRLCRAIDFGNDNKDSDEMPQDDATVSEVQERKTSIQINRKGRMISATNDTIETVNCTEVQNRAQRLNRTALREFNVEQQPVVQLKAGACFRMNPIRLQRRAPKGGMSLPSDEHGVKSSNKTTSMSQLDPMDALSGRMAQRLNEVVAWIGQKEKEISDASFLDKENTPLPTDDGLQGEDHLGRGVVLSVSTEHVRAVTLKFLLGRKPRSKNVDGQSATVGGTLLVLRGNEDMEEWQRLFREKSNFSVFCHAAVSAAARKRLLTSRCAGFDVVLTTFDAIKVKEKTYAVNESGSVVIADHKECENWYSSRHAGTVQKCQQLSLLHGIQWKRIMFMDCLGRSSYVLKRHTARWLAGRALKGNSRFVFFNSSGGSGELEENLKENNKHLRSIAGFILTPESNAADSIVGECMIDFSDITIGKEYATTDHSAEISLNESELSYI